MDDKQRKVVNFWAAVVIASLLVLAPLVIYLGLLLRLFRFVAGV